MTSGMRSETEIRKDIRKLQQLREKIDVMIEEADALNDVLEDEIDEINEFQINLKDSLEEANNGNCDQD